MIAAYIVYSAVWQENIQAAIMQKFAGCRSNRQLRKIGAATIFTVDDLICGFLVARLCELVASIGCDAYNIYCLVGITIPICTIAVDDIE